MKPSETVLEIDLKALEHNYRYLASKVDDNVKKLAVIKAFAYGSDSVALAKKLESLGVDYFAVAYTQEGIDLRNGGITQPILVLHPQSTHFQEIIDQCLTPSIYSEFVLNHFIASAEANQQKNYPIHLKLNTGLNRLGFDPKEVPMIVEKLKQTSSIKVDGIFSHFAASEDVKEKEFTHHQMDTFKKVSDQLIENLGYRPLRHLCNTSGILNYPEAHLDMVRTGIGLYGYGNSKEVDQQLIPIGTLKTIISQIHNIKKGESVGYNRMFNASKDTKTATLPLGHADGINRIYGKQNTNVSIHGNLAPIIGNVCMDMIMVDITGIDCEEGDEVILFGKDKSAEVFAHNAGTISYELITSISQRVKRKIIP
ncbi:alanine racemase [Mesonia ostreae]|uniref:Alanine racemase n=1 Tax=Mesonia ostreae TaxID=861110 RepID=A0ABU2KJ82_9FLAO|nr:alanine racemase [Mesonia ostreae]MDT0294734.1 alanine racemase [Mesonia ostreae]